jgi:hypothetical protein
MILEKYGMKGGADLTDLISGQTIDIFEQAKKKKNLQSHHRWEIRGQICNHFSRKVLPHGGNFKIESKNV